MMRSVLAVMILVAAGCGGGRDDNQQPAAQAGATTGTIHEVTMMVTADEKFVFQPASLQIRVGDRVRWTNVSGGPHNVAFYGDQIPAGAKDLLNAAMANRLTDLTGGLLIQLGETYEVSFAGLPVGTYGYYCTPHEMLGMKAQLTVVR